MINASLSPLADFLVDRASACLNIANSLDWFLAVEENDAAMGLAFAAVRARLRCKLASSPCGRAIAATLAAQKAFLEAVLAKRDAATASKRDSVATKIANLKRLLEAEPALVTLPAPGVAMPTDTGIWVSGVLPNEVTMFKSALYPTAISFRVSAFSPRVDWTGGVQVAGLAVSPAARAAAKLAAAAEARDFKHREETASAAAQVSAIGIGMGGAAAGIGSLASLAPSRIAAAAEAAAAVAGAAAGGVEGGGVGAPSQSPPAASYKVIFKTGDDLRQDQLIIQMVRLMDRQLKRLGLDLCLTPYSVLATGPSAGVMEMVLDSFPVSHVVERFARRGKTPILAFLQEYNPGGPDDPYGVTPVAMDTYVKSAAGYCVITYLLGIGDRHLDNIMLRTDGHFFHIDFGYIFGRDPKPFPPPMRLTVEMIAGMGGYESPNYARFKSYCCQAYNILRRSAGLVTVLLQLMRDSGIDDLHPDPATTIAKVHDKFRVDLDDEEADKVFLSLVDDSVAALFPAFLEVRLRGMNVRA